MSPALVLAFWGTAFVMIVLPGPDWAFVLSSGARDRSVVPAVAGLALGYTLLTVLVAAGIGALVAQNPLMLTVLTFAGAVYLLYLGVRALLARRVRPAAVAAAGDPANAGQSAPITTPDTAASGHSAAIAGTGVSWPTRLAKGIGVSGLNPKGVLVFVAILPQFTSPHGPWPLTIQLVLLGLVFVGTGIGFYLALGWGTHTLVRTRPSLSRTIALISGVAMILIGCALLIERGATLLGG